ncbi:hypothetical protein, partial [Palleronia salina]|uniref:hypothetical protein n=1 Tax=Palleronia salina TaxID=313368 RepID=UPI001BE075B5
PTKAAAPPVKRYLGRHDKTRKQFFQHREKFSEAAFPGTRPRPILTPAKAPIFRGLPEAPAAYPGRITGP